MRLPSVNTELAAAARRIGALRAQIPGSYRPHFDGEAWNRLNRRVAKVDQARALELIAEWEDAERVALSGPLANAPLGEGAA